MARIEGVVPEQGLYLIFNRHEGKGFWRPKSDGYTIWPSQAGFYTGAEVNRITGRSEKNPAGSDRFWVFDLATVEFEADFLQLVVVEARERLGSGS